VFRVHKKISEATRRRPFRVASRPAMEDLSKQKKTRRESVFSRRIKYQINLPTRRISNVSL
jgi:hypothetical protein